MPDVGRFNGGKLEGVGVYEEMLKEKKGGGLISEILQINPPTSFLQSGD